MNHANALPGFGGPSASTEVPLEMLSACHGRVLSQCETLRRLVPHVATHGADTPARQAAGAVMRYFDLAAPHHHEDEEADLFPALIESMAGSDAVCLNALVDGLRQEHRELELRWRALRAALEPLSRGDGGALAPALVNGFVDAYTRHIAREEDELLPMATRLLGDDALARIGQAMRERRGIAPV